MFGYCALQVERDVFEEIAVYFLIVGHTHSLIDQIFSRLSNYIKGCRFIGSPISLQALFSEKAIKYDPYRLTVNRQVRKFYDWKKFLAGKINAKVKNYQIPHAFRFKKIHKR